MLKSILEEVKEKGPCYLSGDGSCDSPGCNGKYLTYSFMDKNLNKIVGFSLIQVSEAGNSNQMEKMGFEKSLRLLKNEGIIPEQITTDRHIQIRKHLRDQEPGIIHQYDVWHFLKSIKKKLLAASKKSSCKITKKWIRLIGNHFWWACAMCEGDPELMHEKCIIVLFHIQNKHEWTGSNRLTKYVHPLLTKKQVKAKEWILPNSEVFEALQKIVLSKNILNDLTH